MLYRLYRLFRRLIKPRCRACGKRREHVPGWYICQRCYDKRQRQPPAVAVAS